MPYVTDRTIPYVMDRDHVLCNGQGPCLMCDVTVSVAAEVSAADGCEEGEVKEQPLPSALCRGRVCQWIVCLGELFTFTLKRGLSSIKVLQILYYN